MEGWGKAVLTPDRLSDVDAFAIPPTWWPEPPALLRLLSASRSDLRTYPPSVSILWRSDTVRGFVSSAAFDFAGVGGTDFCFEVDILAPDDLLPLPLPDGSRHAPHAPIHSFFAVSMPWVLCFRFLDDDLSECCCTFG